MTRLSANKNSNLAINNNLIADIDDIDDIDDKVKLIDTALTRDINEASYKTSRKRSDLYALLSNIAFHMRKNGLKSIEEEKVIKETSRFGINDLMLTHVDVITFRDGRYTFKHEIYLDFIISRNIFYQMSDDSELTRFSLFQTSFMEDYFISRMLQNNKQLIAFIQDRLDDDLDNILKVNMLGLLAKIEGFDPSMVWEKVSSNDDLYELYRQAVVNRVTGKERAVVGDKERLEREIEVGIDPIAKKICGDRRDKPILNYTTTGANPNDPAIMNK
jgi:hypothetical protein